MPYNSESFPPPVLPPLSGAASEGRAGEEGQASEPRVSVITICRNARDLIAPTMVSVLEQTYPNLEYVLQDGGSTDATLAVIEDMLRRYPDRTAALVSERDSGIADAMNRGLRRATGDILIFLHAGDRFVANDVIARALAGYRDAPWRWAVAESIVVDEAGTQKHIYRAAEDYRVLRKKNMIPHQSTLVAKAIFEKHGLFREDLKQGMDYEFWLRIAFVGGERYVVLPFAMTYYLEGGRSSQLRELLAYLWQIRRELRAKAAGFSTVGNLLFVSRVAVFWLISQLKSRSHSPPR